MKKCILFVISALLLAACAEKPVEALISPEQVTLTGNGFSEFKVAGDVKLMMVPQADNDKLWMVRATLPLQKVGENPVDGLDLDLNLLDANGTKLREGFSLVGEDVANMIPLFNAAAPLDKPLVFVAAPDARKDFSFKEACDLISGTQALSLNVHLFKSAASLAAEVAALEEAAQDGAVAAEEAKEKDKPLTLNSLLEKHGVYWQLNQYDKALKDRDKKKAKQIEDKLFSICKKVKADPTVPESLSKKFRDYIETEEDRIEDKY